DEPRAEVDVELHEGFVADVLEAVNLAGFDDEDVAGTPLELDAVHVPASASRLDELDLVIGMPMRTRPSAGFSVEEKDGDVDVAVVGSDEVVGAAFDWEIFAAEPFHRVIPMPAPNSKPNSRPRQVHGMTRMDTGRDSTRRRLR